MKKYDLHLKSQLVIQNYKTPNFGLNVEILDMRVSTPGSWLNNWTIFKCKRTIFLLYNSGPYDKHYSVSACLHWNVWRHKMSFETFLMLPIGTPSFLFSVSQWETSKMFHVTSDATHRLSEDKSLSSSCWLADLQTLTSSIDVPIDNILGKCQKKLPKIGGWTKFFKTKNWKPHNLCLKNDRALNSANFLNSVTMYLDKSTTECMHFFHCPWLGKFEYHSIASASFIEWMILPQILPCFLQCFFLWANDFSISHSVLSSCLTSSWNPCITVRLLLQSRV